MVDNADEAVQKRHEGVRATADQWREVTSDQRRLIQCKDRVIRDGRLVCGNLYQNAMEYGCEDRITQRAISGRDVAAGMMMAGGICFGISVIVGVIPVFRMMGVGALIMAVMRELMRQSYHESC